MNGPIKVVLLGEPVPFARTRPNKAGALFTPTRQRNAAAFLKMAAQQEMLHANYGRAVFDEPLRMELFAEFPIPESWSRKKREAAIRREVLPAKKPDIDNLYKLAADALSGVVYRDDALIVEVVARKVYGVQPKIVVTVGAYRI